MCWCVSCAFRANYTTSPAQDCKEIPLSIMQENKWKGNLHNEWTSWAWCLLYNIINKKDAYLLHHSSTASELWQEMHEWWGRRGQVCWISITRRKQFGILSSSLLHISFSALKGPLDAFYLMNYSWLLKQKLSKSSNSSNTLRRH